MQRLCLGASAAATPTAADTAPPPATSAADVLRRLLRAPLLGKLTPGSGALPQQLPRPIASAPHAWHDAAARIHHLPLTHHSPGERFNNRDGADGGGGGGAVNPRLRPGAHAVRRANSGTGGSTPTADEGWWGGRLEAGGGFIANLTFTDDGAVTSSLRPRKILAMSSCNSPCPVRSFDLIGARLLPCPSSLVVFPAFPCARASRHREQLAHHPRHGELQPGGHGAGLREYLRRRSHH